MTRQTSVYLDLVRFGAAMLVFVGHLSGYRFTGGMLWQLGRYQDDAVTVFFVLSGFVIAYVVSNRERDATDYAIARAARIYSVALPAILLTVVLDWLGSSLRPDLYAANGFHRDGYWIGVAGGALFLDRIWFAAAEVGTMLPYWSLNYEVWYYVIFGVFLFAPERWRVPCLLAVALFVGPRIIGLLPIWLLGVLAYRAGATGRVREGTGWAMCLGGAAGFIIYDVWLRQHGVPDAGVGWLEGPKTAGRYIVGPLFAMHLVGFNAISHRFSLRHDRVVAAIRWAAGATFTIYLFHLPIAQFLTTILPWSPFAWQTSLVMFGAVPVLLFGIAAVTERQKDAWRRLFAGLLGRAGAVPRTQARVAPGGEGG